MLKKGQELIRVFYVNFKKNIFVCFAYVTHRFVKDS
jgi:hypothetical protein